MNEGLLTIYFSTNMMTYAPEMPPGDEVIKKDLKRANLIKEELRMALDILLERPMTRQEYDDILNHLKDKLWKRFKKYKITTMNLKIFKHLIGSDPLPNPPTWKERNNYISFEGHEWSESSNYYDKTYYQKLNKLMNELES